MGNVLKIFLAVFICISFVNANEKYSKENITKHLEIIFKEKIRFKSNRKSYKFNFFKEEVIVYYEFSPSINDKNKKLQIFNQVTKKFEKLLPSLKFKFVQGKPNVVLSEENGLVKTTYSLETIVEEFIHYGFYTRDELFNELKSGYWYETILKGFTPNIYQKIITHKKREKVTEIGTTKTIGNTLKKFQIIEINKDRDKYFREFIEKEIFFTLFGGGVGRWNHSIYIQPSVFNYKEDDFSKEQISKLDWVLLDEFYNNKKLKYLMLYKTEVIPILTEAIYKRMNKEQ